jgi:hypothetical protein
MSSRTFVAIRGLTISRSGRYSHHPDAGMGSSALEEAAGHCSPSAYADQHTVAASDRRHATGSLLLAMAKLLRGEHCASQINSKLR